MQYNDNSKTNCRVFCEHFVLPGDVKGGERDVAAVVPYIVPAWEEKFPRTNPKLIPGETTIRGAARIFGRRREKQSNMFPPFNYNKYVYYLEEYRVTL